jgi:hypothetical protein
MQQNYIDDKDCKKTKYDIMIKGTIWESAKDEHL